MSSTNKLPAHVFHKAWRESFELQKIGNRIGYGNDRGWLICADNEPELVEAYMNLVRAGVIDLENIQ